jgi:hypothetical protein
MLFNLGGGANGTDLLLEVTYTPARHGEQVFETLAGAPYTSAAAAGAVPPDTVDAHSIWATSRPLLEALC